MLDQSKGQGGFAAARTPHDHQATLVFSQDVGVDTKQALLSEHHYQANMKKLPLALMRAGPEVLANLACGNVFGQIQCHPRLAKLDQNSAISIPNSDATGTGDNLGVRGVDYRRCVGAGKIEVDVRGFGGSVLQREAQLQQTADAMERPTPAAPDADADVSQHA